MSAYVCVFWGGFIKKVEYSKKFLLFKTAALGILDHLDFTKKSEAFEGCVV